MRLSHSKKDFFPIGGAKWTFEEARRIYSLYGMESNLRLIHGQGGHCNLGPVTDQLMAFIMSHLFPGETAAKKFQQVRLKNFDKLIGHSDRTGFNFTELPYR